MILSLYIQSIFILFSLKLDLASGRHNSWVAIERDLLKPHPVYEFCLLLLLGRYRERTLQPRPHKSHSDFIYDNLSVSIAFSSFKALHAIPPQTFWLVTVATFSKSSAIPTVVAHNMLIFLPGLLRSTNSVC